MRRGHRGPTPADPAPSTAMASPGFVAVPPAKPVAGAAGSAGVAEEASPEMAFDREPAPVGG